MASPSKGTTQTGKDHSYSPQVDLKSSGTSKGGITIVNHLPLPKEERGCNLQSSDWLKIISAIGLVFSIALLAFLACYTDGIFHFEMFIGHIGPYVSLVLASSLVVASILALYLSFRVSNEKEVKGPVQVRSSEPAKKIAAKEV
jgi:hypothetical protein